MRGKKIFLRRGKSRRQRLEEQGERYEQKEMIFCYAAVLLIAVLCGVGMSLKPFCLCIVIFLCLLQAPAIYFYYKKARLESRRFNDANAYMAQMVQSFAANGKILASLKETRDTCWGGMLWGTLNKAVCHIEQSCDMELAEQEALGFLCAQYDCERVRMLHDFLMKAESRGGSCEAEFGLLENIRRLWEKNALRYQNTAVTARNLVSFEYLLLMWVCMFMLHQFPQELAILHLPLVQGLNTFLVVCFFWVFRRMDKKCGQSMLRDYRRMSEAEAGAKLSCLSSFEGKRAMCRQLPFALGALTFTLVCWAGLRSKGLLVIGLIGSAVILCGGRIRYGICMQAVRTEIRSVFPGWLFDVLLLTQSENVSVALLKSLEKAPAVLKEALQQLQRELTDSPLSPDAYLGFLVQYRIPEVEGIMRKLYALSCGTGACGEVMNQIIDMNMTMLSEDQSRRLKLKGDLFSLYYMLPTVPVMICMAGYGAALMAVIFQNILTVI